MAMKLQVVLFFISLAGIKLSLAQDVIDCTDIAANLNTMGMDPVTGKAKDNVVRTFMVISTCTWPV